MSHFKAAEISAAGMLGQKARIEAATANLANMHASSPPGVAGYQPLVAVMRATGVPFSAALGTDAGEQIAPVQVDIVPQVGLVATQAYEPGHPNADANGMVSYPAVNQTQEMMTVMTALRAYEANLAALQAVRTMAAKALEIGGQS